MTDREKVIKGLEFTKAMITFNPSTGEDVEPGNLNEENKISYDACVGAIALLKEQEPVEPKLVGVNTWICGECGALLGWEEFTQSGLVLVENKYCPECGRAVKWDESKNT